MIRGRASSAQLQRLIELGKPLRPVPQVVRARVLERASTSALLGPLVPNALPAPPRSLSISWVGGAAIALGVAGGAFALHAHTPARVVSEKAAVAPSISHSTLPPEPALAETMPAPPQASAGVLPAERAPRPSPSDSYAAELELLRRAHRAYAAGDFAAALRWLSDHSRRFPNGRLAEEREALRVRSLSSSGHGEAARGAAKEFAVRFPRSVLLSRTVAVPDSGG